MAKVTKTDVQTAIDSLRTDGVNPTNKAIREFIGSGSNATINKYRKEIIDGEVSSEVKANNTLSDDEIRKLGDTFSQLLVNRLDDLGNTYADDKKALEQDNADLSLELDNAQKTIEQLEQDKQQLENDKLILNSDVSKLERQIQEQMNEIKSLYQKVGQVELLQQQLEQARANPPKATRK